jgi:putative endonuclease
MKQRIQLGKKGETLVAQYLAQQGFSIKEINFSLRCGEIDIIAFKDKTLAFVEVKVRTTAYFHISEVVNYAKQKKIIQTARNYIAQHQCIDMNFRFDVALIEAQDQDFAITYIPNAFAPGDEYA